MKLSIQTFLPFFILMLFSSSLYSQETDFSERQAIIKTTENFFIGDHTGSIKHKKLSMHPKGAYRYVNRNGEYGEGTFDLDSGEADTSYQEEVLSIEIYDKVALVRVRMAEVSGGQHYKMLTLHKAGGKWKITTITWGSEITQ